MACCPKAGDGLATKRNSVSLMFDSEDSFRSRIRTLIGSHGSIPLAFGMSIFRICGSLRNRHNQLDRVG